MPSQEELRAAFQVFDVNGDGSISQDELVAILTRKTGGTQLFTKQEAEEVFRRVDTTGDGRIDYEEFAVAFASNLLTPPTAPVPAPARGSLAPPDGKPANEAPPAAEFLRLIKEGRVVPDEAAGPYALASYHANVTGAHRGYKDRAGYDAWHAKGKAAMLTFRSWAELNWTKVDPEFAIHYGYINGRGLPMREIRPTIIAARKAMVETYSAAFEAARKPPGAAEVFASIAALPEKTGKVRQPGGTSLDLLGLYRGALAALPGLWRLAGAIAEASGEAGVHASWGVKKAQRIWFKLNTKYGGDVSCAPRRPAPAPRAARSAAACAPAAAK